MPTLSTIAINGKQYYKADDIRTAQPTYFVGCTKSIRKIIERKSIPESECTFMTYTKKTNAYKQCDASTTKAALFITKEWVDRNVPGFGNDDIKLDIEKAPPILELADHEKLCDTEGNIMDIEVRGTRDRNGCYFKASDVARCFEMPYLNTTLSHQEREYIRNIHYKTFITPGYYNEQTKEDKRLFLTYKGLIKVLYSSRSGNAEKFQDWAENILFAAQMGTVEQKQKVAATILGSSIDDVRNVLSRSPMPVSSLYLICIGQVGDMQEHMPELNKYNAADSVFKFGYSEDLTRRLAEHKRILGKIKGAAEELSVVCYVPVDDQYLSNAESELKQEFQDIDAVIEHPTYKELVVFNEKRLPLIKKIFRNICEKYAGRVKNLQSLMEQQRQDYEQKKKIYALKMEYELREVNMRLENEQRLHCATQRALDVERSMREDLMAIMKNFKVDGRS